MDIEMSNEELLRKSAIEGVLERRESQKVVSARLGISKRQFRRLLQRYRREGQSGLVSKKRGVPSNRKMAQSMPGWKIAGQKPLCWSLWMMPPARSWKLNLFLKKASLATGTCVNATFGNTASPRLSIVTALASFGSIAEIISGMNRLRNSNGLSAPWGSN